MNASELRIGNLVEFKGEHYRLHEFDHTLTMISFDTDTGGTYGPGIPHPPIKAIPLSSDWLERFGFENKGNNVFEGRDFKIGIDSNGGINWLWYHGQHISVFDLSFVHQWQNLFFSLRGSELEIKAHA